MAVAPTATISNISGTTPGIEPIYKNIYVKSNISGDFIVVNPYMIEDLKAAGVWNEEMLQAIKYNDGSLADIPQVPADLKSKYKETFEIDMRWIVRAAAVRGKWIDQSQSLNIFFNGTSGSELSDLYIYAWEIGLKTTYYLRSLGASQVEKSTVGTEGTHLRKGRGEKKVGESDADAVSAAQTVSVQPIASGMQPSPIATPSPITRASIESHKVEVSKPRPEIKLHVAEEAICEACQ
jgi:ribonucleoside-diphosphate reductase alpha chain